MTSFLLPPFHMHFIFLCWLAATRWEVLIQRSEGNIGVGIPLRKALNLQQLDVDLLALFCYVRLRKGCLVQTNAFSVSHIDFYLSSYIWQNSFHYIAERLIRNSSRIFTARKKGRWWKSSPTHTQHALGLHCIWVYALRLERRVISASRMVNLHLH